MRFQTLVCMIFVCACVHVVSLGTAHPTVSPTPTHQQLRRFRTKRAPKEPPRRFSASPNISYITPKRANYLINSATAGYHEVLVALLLVPTHPTPPPSHPTQLSVLHSSKRPICDCQGSPPSPRSPRRSCHPRPTPWPWRRERAAGAPGKTGRRSGRVALGQRRFTGARSCEVRGAART